MALFSAGEGGRVQLAVDPVMTCTLCLEEKALRAMYELQECKCKYCTTCMKAYLEVNIHEGYIMSITCPDAACHRSGKLKISEIRDLVEPEVFDKYMRLKFEREVEIDPHRTFCPEVGCETICHVCISSGSAGGPSTSSGSIKPRPVMCPTCSLQFCAVCKAKWHGELTCDENMKLGSKEEEGIPFQSPADADIKRCPLCLVPIERNDGCAQMMCKRCKHVFCWYCLASLDNDFLLRHYDNGPCKNRLGHSRASVMWHRTQVVGIFAGFGVLLLVASPFLLLAAPCILCCKCKASKCCDDDDLTDTLPSTS
ncbi:hypothetical protein CAPTEDRAFT_180577 [Capitella teleta]|uniref:E3 ubiquitin-protein ligase RNF144B n=1 Tax=Capitella teleta TaxID=283909 RepID=R7VEA5_CAPTE|nr:hypothetical protein CAPTEDRAFT_180577 [Capitella teleta]|eukprot:ELU14626.1 hypothetical protein CAPTEDRAFT_180577 [Capitella teleta]